MIEGGPRNRRTSGCRSGQRARWTSSSRDRGRRGLRPVRAGHHRPAPGLRGTGYQRREALHHPRRWPTCHGVRPPPIPTCRPTGNLNVRVSLGTSGWTVGPKDHNDGAVGPGTPTCTWTTCGCPYSRCDRRPDGVDKGFSPRCACRATAGCTSRKCASHGRAAGRRSLVSFARTRGRAATRSGRSS